MKSNQKLALLLFAIIVALTSQSFTSCRHSEQNQLALADASVVWWMGPGIIAQKKGLYEKNGLIVKSFDVQTGLASKNAVVSGSADVGLVASSPLATAAFSKEPIIVLCSYVESNQLLSVITPATTNEGFSKPTPPVAIVKGTISEFFLYNYLTKTLKLSREEIASIIGNELNVKPPDVTNAMKTGDAKSTSIWEPFGTMIASSNANLRINRPADIYTHRIYIITTPQVLQKKRSALEAFVRSFKDASELIMHTDPNGSKEVIRAAFPPQEQSMKMLWDKVDFSMKFDYERMRELIFEDAEILFNLGLTPKDSSGKPRRLSSADVQYLFNHDFKLPQ